MKVDAAATVLWLVFAQLLLAQDPAAVEKAAAKYVPGITWQARSVVSGNFTCRGRKEQAILGVSASEILVAVFVTGTNAPPELLRYSAKARNPKTAELAVEDLDYDPKQDIGYEPDGFQRSKSCKGLNLGDGLTDSAHIYWNRKSHRFEDWTL
ncbi:MAG TPA: hypothetical protein VLY04_04225 [Bryobacteraceae bacterium]|nr:hypothetical protein [Bryobacteraceae bacterium]